VLFFPPPFTLANLLNFSSRRLQKGEPNWMFAFCNCLVLFVSSLAPLGDSHWSHLRTDHTITSS
jgi:hypothetical protein